MDKAQLAEVTARDMAEARNGRELAVEDVERVIDALFGTVERPGSIAKALKQGETVTTGSFGGFHPDGGSAALRPGKALLEFLDGTTR